MRVGRRSVPFPRTRVHRVRENARSDRAAIDANLAVWAGEIPLVTRATAPLQEPTLNEGLAVPSPARRHLRPGLTA